MVQVLGIVLLLSTAGKVVAIRGMSSLIVDIGRRILSVVNSKSPMLTRRLVTISATVSYLIVPVRVSSSPCPRVLNGFRESHLPRPPFPFSPCRDLNVNLRYQIFAGKNTSQYNSPSPRLPTSFGALVDIVTYIWDGICHREESRIANMKGYSMNDKSQTESAQQN